MNKQEFIDYLKSDTVELAVKLECCQFFVDNFPVEIDSLDPMNPFKKHKILTKLDVKIDGGSEKSINFAFEQLQKKIKELEEFNNQNE